MALRRLRQRRRERSRDPGDRVVRDQQREQVMRDPAADAELDRYGFTVLDLLDATEVERVMRIHDDIGVAPDDPRVSINWSFHSRSGEHKRRVDTALRQELEARVDALFLAHEPFLATFITKWPGPNSAFAPHQDPSLIDERRGQGFTVWIPLVDTGMDGTDNGLLRFVPGTHRFSSCLRSTDVDLFPFAEHERAIVEELSVGVGMKAGQALIFDNRVIHFSMPNTTDGPRVVTSFGMRPVDQSCILLRRVDDTSFNVHEISDDFYLDVPPSEQHQYQPDSPVIDTVQIETRRWDPVEFDQLCRDVAGVPTSVRHPIAPSGTLTDPGSFCSFCGKPVSDVDRADRARRNNAQLVCAECRAAQSADLTT